MALGNPINVRLSVEKQLMYEAEAEARGIGIGTYLRGRLEDEDAILEELSSLRRAFERVAGANGSSNYGRQETVMLEMLLLLRQIAQGEKTQRAQQELKRLGLKIWDGQLEEAE